MLICFAETTAYAHSTRRCWSSPAFFYWLLDVSALYKCTGADAFSPAIGERCVDVSQSGMQSTTRMVALIKALNRLTSAQTSEKFRGGVSPIARFVTAGPPAALPEARASCCASCRGPVFKGRGTSLAFHRVLLPIRPHLHQPADTARHWRREAGKPAERTRARERWSCESPA